MRLLLDSNIVVPIASKERDKLGAQVNLLLNARANDFFVSVASLWEIAIKTRLGKLPLNAPLQQLPAALSALGYAIVAIDRHHAIEDLIDQPDTNDPFDRMLLAQCQVEGMRLVTTDRALMRHPLAWRPA
ncbi:MAG: type II toxin-antitoxin system VapC family toxin [Alphaproteobacteria bacterium]|nr:type II toxin-antitoxin system VapC family toxin [Alphaproteobacteria bacterium]MBV9692490.1 type II toxin-antitoxin system VapC family toxin [Alphaproteobacteria bacterium]